MAYTIGGEGRVHIQVRKGEGGRGKREGGRGKGEGGREKGEGGRGTREIKLQQGMTKFLR